MFTVSGVLQRARLDQGIDLATVAARTKIDAKFLRAIEADDRQSLPGSFFYKSFVHQYATFLGVDTKAIDAEADRVLSMETPLPLPGTARQSAVKLLPQSRPSTKYLSFAALVLLVVASARIDEWWHKSRTPAVESRTRGSAPGLSTKPVSLTSVSQVTVHAAPAAAAATQDDPAASAGSGIELALTATEETWLSVSSDGIPVFSGLLKANETKTIDGKQTANLRVGNAAGLEVRWNGKLLGSLGAHGQIRNLAFTSDKFQFVL